MEILFGLAEAKKFCESHEDPRVRAVWRWLCEARSKNAQWCDALNKAEEKLKENNRPKTYEEFLEEGS